MSTKKIRVEVTIPIQTRIDTPGNGQLIDYTRGS